MLSFQNAAQLMQLKTVYCVAYWRPEWVNANLNCWLHIDTVYPNADGYPISLVISNRAQNGKSTGTGKSRYTGTINNHAGTAQPVNMKRITENYKTQLVINCRKHTITVSGFYPYTWWAQLAPSEK